MRRASRHGLANALFTVAAAEALPCELDSKVSAVSIHFPWGSLLRAVVAPSPTVLDGIARVLAPGGTLTALPSITTRDGAAPLSASSIDPAAYARSGLRVSEWRAAITAEVAGSDSSWAKRLGAGASRPVWLLTAVSPGSWQQKRAARRRPSS